MIAMIAQGVGVRVDDDVKLRISRVSDGFPHYIHLLCQKMLWLAQRADSVIEVIDAYIYRAAVAETVESVEAHLRLGYDKAVKKDKDEYREILWAVADRFEQERHIRRVYEESYPRIMLTRNRIPLEFDKFQACLANLRSERHGGILVSEQRSWIGFRESIMRGYVRLMAEASGLAIAL